MLVHFFPNCIARLIYAAHLDADQTEYILSHTHHTVFLDNRSRKQLQLLHLVSFLPEIMVITACKLSASRKIQHIFLPLKLFRENCHHWGHLSFKKKQTKKTRNIFTSKQHVYIKRKANIKGPPTGWWGLYKNILRVWCTDCKRSISVKEDTSCHIFFGFVSVGCERCYSLFMLITAPV